MGNANNSKMRSIHVDMLKGLAIALVVLGHGVQTNIGNFDQNLLFRIIYSFHMPLFMFLSGYITWLKRAQIRTVEYLSSRFLRLVVPFMAWYMLGYLLSGIYARLDFLAYLRELINSPELGLWFLWTLFLCSCLLYLALLVMRKFNADKFSDYLLVGCAIFIKYIPLNIFGFYLVKWYFMFFVIGYLVSKHIALIKKWKNKIYAVSIVVFPLLVSFWMRDGNALFLPQLRNSENVFLINNSGQIMIIYSLIVPLFGIAFVSFLVQSYAKTYLSRIFVFLGKHTMNIYIIQNFIFFGVGNYLLTSFYFGGTILKVLESVIMVITISLIFAVGIIGKVPWLRVILLGQKK
jgi:fucose 4-O-acetylase-like acetyltransferase